jgi:hypothetical protein
MGSDFVVSFLEASMVWRASLRFRNQCSFKHSSRILPLKLSMKAFWIGFPGSMKCSLMPRSEAQTSSRVAQRWAQLALLCGSSYNLPRRRLLSPLEFAILATMTDKRRAGHSFPLTAWFFSQTMPYALIAQ